MTGDAAGAPQRERAMSRARAGYVLAMAVLQSNAWPAADAELRAAVTHFTEDGRPWETSLPSGGRSEERQKLLAEYYEVRPFVAMIGTRDRPFSWMDRVIVAADKLASHIRSTTNEPT